MNRWQTFFDLAAAQFAILYAQNRTISDEERRANADRYAASAKVFANAFAEVDLTMTQRTADLEATPLKP